MQRKKKKKIERREIIRWRCEAICVDLLIQVERLMMKM